MTQLWRSSTTTPVADTRLTFVESVKRFARLPDVYQVRWREGRKKRTILVAIEQWTTADRTIADAVANVYPPESRPNVIVPERAWR